MADSNKLKPVAISHILCNFKPCTNHPSHRQSPGVCSLCVNEKLARLSTTSRSSTSRRSGYSDSSSSSLSEVSSCSSSECLSPSEVRAKYAKRGSVSFVKRREKAEEEDDVVLSKSKSMAAAFVRRVRSGGEKVKRSGGFWSKVLKRTKRKKMER